MIDIVIFGIGVVAAIVVGLVIGTRDRKKVNRSNRIASSRVSVPQGVDSVDPPEQLSADEREHLRKVAEYCGKRYVTNEDMRAYIIHTIDMDFQSMDGWCEWDSSIHEQAGQYDRLHRGVTEKLNVIAYDSIHRIAKVSGSTGRTYITSYRQCSCPDFRARLLPCKHMYSLCVALEGNPQKSIPDSAPLPLYGLRIALAGRFGSKDDPNGVRAQINRMGGVWANSINQDTSLLVCGKEPSASKILAAQNYGIHVIDVQELDSLFAK